jgi:hypothetical protein
MISIKSDKVVFSNPNVVKYFTKYYKNTTFLTSCESLLETFCKNTDDFILQYSNEQKYDLQTNRIILQLESFEKKNDEIALRINNIADDILSKVSNQLTTLILSIDNIISSSVSKFNTNTLQEFIIKTLEENNKESTFQLQEHLQANIVSPIHETQKQLMVQLEQLPKLLSQTSNFDFLEQKLQSMNSKWLTVIDSIIVEIKQLDKNSPLVIKGVLGDLVHDLEKQTSNISYVVSNIQKDISFHTTNLALIKSSSDDLKVKVDSLDKQLLTKQTKENNSNSHKGSVAEETLFNLLCEKLMTRDGFCVSKVNGISHSCDILIQRDDFPDIRIESKAHGQYTGEKIRSKEVEKFERDLLELDNHGIFVSVYSDIASKGQLEIIQLPNAKFAIYLSKNRYDCDIIQDMIYLLYKLDEIITTSNTNSKISLTPETILKIQNIIKTTSVKLNTVKSSLKDSISVLNSISLEQIELVLNNFQQNPASISTDSTCGICGFVSKNLKGLASHQRKCDKSEKIMSK